MNRLHRCLWPILVALSVLGCDNNPPHVTPLALVPSDAVIVVEMHWQEVRKDPYLRRIAEQGRLLEQLATWGVSGDATDVVLAFSRGLSTSASDETVLFTGREVGRHVVLFAKREGWSREDLVDCPLFRPPSGTQQVCVPNDDLAIVGESSAVSAVLGVVRGQATSLLGRSDLSDVRATLTSGRPVMMAIVWPTTMRDTTDLAVAAGAGLVRLVGWEPIAGLIDKLGVGRACVMTLAPDSHGLLLELEAAMQDETTASTVAGILSLMKTVARWTPPGTSKIPGTPDASTVTVDRRGAVLSVSMVVQN